MAEPQKSEEKLHMGAIPYDAERLSDSVSEEICKSLLRIVTVNVIMKSRMRESRTYGTGKDFTS